VPRPPRHPLTSRLLRALPPSRDRTDEAFLRLLDRRLAALERVAGGRKTGPAGAGMTRAERALARRVLGRRHAAWHDGDENLVRGTLDRWGTDRGPGERARGLLEAASALAAIDPPPGVLWFFLWEMESVLAGLFEADKGGGPC
jgi:hypothetical protein